MDIFSKIRGTLETLFQLGVSGPQIKNNAGAIEARDATDANFTNVRGAVPVGPNDFTTNAFVFGPPNANQYYLDPTSGSDANDGLTPGTAWKTFDRAKEVIRLLKYAPASYGAMTISILSNVTGDVNIIADWETTGPAFLTIDGSLATTPNGGGVLATVTPANPATPTEWRISITAFDFSTRVGQYAEVTSGPNAGVGFFVLHDLGAGNAIISQPHVALSYQENGTSVVSPTDNIQFQTLPRFGDTLIVSGTGDFGLQKIIAGNSLMHDVQFNDAGLIFVDTCAFSTFDVSIAGDAEVYGSFAHHWRAYAASYIDLFAGGADSNIVLNNDGNIAFSWFTVCGGTLTTGIGSGGQYQLGAWLAVSFTATALSLGNASVLRTMPFLGSDIRLFGTNLTGPKINNAPGSHVFYDSAHPINLVGSGTDVLLSGISYTLSQLPVTDYQSGIVDVSAAPPIPEALGASYFGVGQDGDLAPGFGTITLTKDTFYRFVTPGPGDSIVTSSPAGAFYLGILRLDDTGASAGYIKGNGPNGGSSAGTAGGLAPTNAVTGSMKVGSNGTVGGVGAALNGSQGGAGLTGVNGGPSGASGAGGAGAGGHTGGAARAANGVGAPVVRQRRPLVIGATSTTGAGGCGGGGGGGDGTNAGGGGGGGGAGGIQVAIGIRQWKRGGTSPAAGIQARGGVAGNGFSAAVGAVGGGGGGAGGGGGDLYVIVGSLEGTAAANVLDASGGAGGNAGTGTNANGTPGQGGNGGHITFWNLQLGTMTEVDGTGTPGSAGSGVTGGAGAPAQLSV